MAAAPNIAESVVDAGTLTEPSVIALDEFVPHIEPIARVRDGGSWRWSLVAAWLLHVGIIAAFSYTPADTMLGGGGTQLESISVDVVSAAALEVVASAQARAPASQTEQRLADLAGGENERAASVRAPDQKSERASETPSKAEVADLVIPDVIIKPEPLVPDQPAIVIAPAEAEQPVEAPEMPDETKSKVPTQDASMPSVATDDAMAEQVGGVLQRGLSAVEIAMQSATVARAGEIAAYARQVQFAVAKNPPKPPPGTGGRGEVVITFALGLDGSLSYARVFSSSGSSLLDDAALKAVRGTQFPPPPSGSQISQLVYKFPVKFR